MEEPQQIRDEARATVRFVQQILDKKMPLKFQAPQLSPYFWSGQFHWKIIAIDHLNMFIDQVTLMQYEREA